MGAAESTARTDSEGTRASVGSMGGARRPNTRADLKVRGLRTHTCHGCNAPPPPLTPTACAPAPIALQLPGARIMSCTYTMGQDNEVSGLDGQPRVFLDIPSEIPPVPFNFAVFNASSDECAALTKLFEAVANVVKSGEVALNMKWRSKCGRARRVHRGAGIPRAVDRLLGRGGAKLTDLSGFLLELLLHLAENEHGAEEDEANGKICYCLTKCKETVPWPGLASTADEAPAAEEGSSSGDDARPHPRGILQTTEASFIGLLLAKFQRYGAASWASTARTSERSRPSSSQFNCISTTGATTIQGRLQRRDYAWREGKLVRTGRYHSLLVAASDTPMRLAGTRNLFIGKLRSDIILAVPLRHLITAQLMHWYVARGSGSFEKILGSGCPGAALFHLPLDSGLTPGLLAEFHPNWANGGHSGGFSEGKLAAGLDVAQYLTVAPKGCVQIEFPDMSMPMDITLQFPSRDDAADFCSRGPSARLHSARLRSARLRSARLRSARWKPTRASVAL
ncbi:hypothetical protein T492DRAFT_1134716 [Pavlovales sp. CCMP2436]|nr:hypothetical protein T492DRAFT_1134716 [Pavlovales sp. CCMP2436]